MCSFILSTSIVSAAHGPSSMTTLPPRRISQRSLDPRGSLPTMAATCPGCFPKNFRPPTRRRRCDIVCHLFHLHCCRTQTTPSSLPTLPHHLLRLLWSPRRPGMAKKPKRIGSVSTTSLPQKSRRATALSSTHLDGMITCFRNFCVLLHRTVEGRHETTMARSRRGTAHLTQIFLRAVTQRRRFATIREQMHLQKRLTKSVFVFESSHPRLGSRPQRLSCVVLHVRGRSKECSDVGEGRSLPTEDDRHQSVWCPWD